ncbi:hypothetical protein CN188_09635 [Sinorhizobium meliloti]|uniref:DUF6950 family protein n=1 Tax=Rhizobium meliloti TaxID=382 RepID=UPI000FDB65F6|nr:hypothetical protein [Sinorhizobium meliloti]RVI83921.1 hypothetical protein CN188_09635 [Sinorhizobium meliloti]
MEPDLSDRLRAFIAEAQGSESVWGVSDCSKWAAAWVEQVHGRKIRLPHWRSRHQAHRLIAKAGSLDRLWSEALAEFRLFETGRPKLGDVGVIDTCRYGQVGGIFGHGDYFAWRAETGVAFIVPRIIVKAWAIQ